MNKVLTTLLEVLYKRDTKAIEHIIKNFDYKEDDYVKPPKVEDTVKDIMCLEPETYEFVDGKIHLKHTETNGIKLPEQTIEFLFKFKDVRTRRKRIFRTGDYYMKLYNTGFDKWIWQFYIKAPELINGKMYNSFALAQHPHVSKGNACLSQMETGIRSSITNYNFKGFIWRMRTFLDSWNYRSPYNFPNDMEYKRIVTFNKEGLNLIQESPSLMMYSPRQLMRDFPDSIEIDDGFSFTSARKKTYDSEPLTRLLYTIGRGLEYESNTKYDSIQTTELIKIIPTLAKWLTNSIEDITKEESFILALDIRETFWRQLKANNKMYEGQWSPDYDTFSREINRFRNTLQHIRYREDAITYTSTHTFTNAYTWYLSSTDDNPETGSWCKELVRQLNEIEDALVIAKDNIKYGEGTSYSELKKMLQKNIIEFMLNRYDDKFTIEEILSQVEEHKIDDNEPKNIEDEIEKWQSSFKEIAVCLSKEYNNQMIKYHKEELRRLTNEENTETEQENNLSLETESI